ncbi:TPA: radical SAM protein [Vibrio parahaemolyticus]|nr:radical SAM protein [Vibrio parahaemolyticus]
MNCKELHKSLFIQEIDDNFTLIANSEVKGDFKIFNNNQVSLLFDFMRFDDCDLLHKYSLNSEELIHLKEKYHQIGVFSSTHSTNYKKVPISKIPNSLNIWVHLTNECNLRCSYCYIHNIGKRSSFSKEMMLTLNKKIFQTAKRNNLSQVILRFAGGEPFLHYKLVIKTITELREQLLEIGCKLKIAFLTNLTLLNEEILEFIVDNNVGLSVSLDGLEYEHNLTRKYTNGKGSFKRVSSNIDKLLKNNISPFVMSVITNDNMDGLKDFTEFLVEKNLNHRYSLVQHCDLDLGKLSYSLRGVYSYFECQISKGYQFSKKHKFADLKLLKPSFQNCSSGYNGGAINTNGDIYFCQQNIEAGEPIGTLTSDNDLIDVLQSTSYLNDNISRECLSCKFKHICNAGCPLYRESGTSPFCGIFKEFIPVIYYLLGKERVHNIELAI